MNISITFTNILLHVLIMFSFLTIFFFTVGNKIEGDIVKKQVNFLINDLIGNTFNVLSTTEKNNIKSKLDTLFNKDSFKQQDEQVSNNNKKIFNEAIYSLVIFVVIILILILIIGLHNKWSKKMLSIFINISIFTLIFIAIAEISFMFLIASNYISTDPNKIKEKILDELFKNSKECTKNNNCLITK